MNPAQIAAKSGISTFWLDYEGDTQMYVAKQYNYHLAIKNNKQIYLIPLLKV